LVSFKFRLNGFEKSAAGRDPSGSRPLGSLAVHDHGVAPAALYGLFGFTSSAVVDRHVGVLQLHWEQSPRDARVRKDRCASPLHREGDPALLSIRRHIADAGIHDRFVFAENELDPVELLLDHEATVVAAEDVARLARVPLPSVLVVHRDSYGHLVVRVLRAVVVQLVRCVLRRVDRRAIDALRQSAGHDHAGERQSNAQRRHELTYVETA
jgi:hypothetical protein